MTEIKSIQLTSDEITLLYWMAGYASNELPKVFEKNYNSFMKKLGEASVNDVKKKLEAIIMMVDRLVEDWRTVENELKPHYIDAYQNIQDSINEILDVQSPGGT